MKFRVAVIIFPGTNCETETKRSLLNAGLQAEYVRWNEAQRLKEFDAFVIPGGFAYEDRSRAGIIAAQDPMMNVIKAEAAAGKPVIGICNGCQILVETGLIPGLPNNALAGAVAMNTRVKNGQIIGTGFYHDTIYIKNIAPAGRSCITTNVPQDMVIPATVANGEGRFIFSADLLVELEKNHQIIFKYATQLGHELNEFPTTPNGAIWGIAGLCNPAGNVVAYMPHPERLEREGESLFNNLRAWLENPPQPEPYTIQWQPRETVINTYQSQPHCLQFFVSLMITDNAAKTIELTLQQRGFPVRVKRQTHWEVWYQPETNVNDLATKLVESGELLNTNKEVYAHEHAKAEKTLTFLVQYSDDFEGLAVTKTLRDRFGLTTIANVRKGVVWELTIPAETDQQRLAIATEILKTHILFNPYAQECSLMM